MVAASHRKSPTNQVFFNEAGVALDASKRMSSPSSAYEEEKKKVRITNCRSGSVRLRCTHSLPLQPCQSSFQGPRSLLHHSGSHHQGSPSPSASGTRYHRNHLVSAVMPPRSTDCAYLLLAFRRHQSISPRCCPCFLLDPFDPFQVFGMIQSLDHILQPRRENDKE